MKAPRYIENNVIEEKYRKKCMELHYRKIEAIAHRPSEKQRVEYINLVRQRNEMLQHASDTRVASIEESIQRRNFLLIEKLAEICKGAHCTTRLREPQSMPRSLNLSARKKVSTSIEEENIRLAKRLVTKKGEIDSRALEADFQAHCKYRDIIKRVRQGSPGCNPSRNILPPIHTHRTFNNQHSYLF